MKLITIVGHKGFIGSYLKEFYKNEKLILLHKNYKNYRDYGHIFYCAGVINNFSSRAIESVEAHVCDLKNFIKNKNFKKLIYLSSTRMDEMQLKNSKKFFIDPFKKNHIYNITKLCGEMLCYNSSKKTTIIRLPNVYEKNGTNRNLKSRINYNLSNNKNKFLKKKKKYIEIMTLMKFLN
jgi:nucleoside-diphosphate-sugar epimerase